MNSAIISVVPRESFFNFGKLAIYSLFVAILMMLSLAYVSGFFLKEVDVWLLRKVNQAALLPLMFFVAQYILVCYLLRSVKSHRIVNLVLGCLVFNIYICFSIEPLGDHAHWAMQSATNRLWLSEVLANFTYSAFYKLGLDIRYVAPVFGLLTFYVYAYLGKELISCDGAKVYYVFLYRVGFLSSVSSVLFFFNYVENTLLSLPFSMLYFYFSVTYLRGRRKDLRDLVLSTAAISVACMFHGQNFFILPSLFIFICAKNFNKNEVNFFVRDLAVSAVVFLSVILFGVVALSVGGYEIVAGNVHGGGDNAMFVPMFSDDVTLYTRFLMFTFDHFHEVSNIVIHSSPGVLFLLILFVINVLGGRRFSLGGVFEIDKDPVFLVSSVLCLGFLSFIFLWNFDLGFPVDLDLMVSLGCFVNVAVFYVLYRFPANRSVLLPMSVFFGLVVNMFFVSRFLTFRL